MEITEEVVVRIIPVLFCHGQPEILTFWGLTTDFLVIFKTKISLKPLSAKALRINQQALNNTYATGFDITSFPV